MEAIENLSDEESNVSTLKGTKSKNSTKSISKKSKKQIDDGETTPELALKKRLGFENCDSYKLIFEKQYEYLGHVGDSDNFKAKCKLCTAAGKEKNYSFDSNSFKSNGNRHYTVN